MGTISTGWIAPIDDFNIAACVNLSFTVVATDPQGNDLVMTLDELPPTGASFIDNGDGTADFNWTPGETDLGTWNFNFFGIKFIVFGMFRLSGYLISGYVCRVNRKGKHEQSIYYSFNRSDMHKSGIISGRRIYRNRTFTDPL